MMKNQPKPEPRKTSTNQKQPESMPVSKKGLEQQTTSSKNKSQVSEIQSTTKPRPGTHILGIGASAGGLEALESFLKALPDDIGIGIVIVTHLDPNHVSILPELLQRQTELPVMPVADGMPVKKNEIYVIPSNKDLTIFGNKLFLSERSQPRGGKLPIDSFLESLAQDQGALSICAILSGTGTDGSLGLKAIKGARGMVMVQDVDSAKFDGMPQSAISTGLVDFVLTPDKMPEQIKQYLQYSTKPSISLEEATWESHSEDISKIFSILLNRTGHDFSLYKPKALLRRINRRMNLQQLEKLSDYVRYLTDSDQESTLLFKELLIGVTQFFRDPEAFEFLQTSVLPELFKSKASDASIRIWVPACSTGEEAYSLAIILHESMERLGQHHHLQIFGTDLDDEAIDVARTGSYPPSILADVGDARIKRYFVKEKTGHFKIKNMIRGMLVFAPHSVIKDPPFTKLDLLSCRNLLIYLGNEQQQRLFRIFHYCLNPAGILFLSPAESLGKATDLFSTVHKKWKIFCREKADTNRSPVFATGKSAQIHKDRLSMKSFTDQPLSEVDTLELLGSMLSHVSSAPSVIMQSTGDILYFHGNTEKYLMPGKGKASMNIVQMACAGLKEELVRVLRPGKAFTREVIIKDIQIGDIKDGVRINVTIKPIQGKVDSKPLLIVFFQDNLAEKNVNKHPAQPAKNVKVKKNVSELEKQLKSANFELELALQEAQTNNEELQSTNEELQSINEELQSTNEELETTQEELQSLNEESMTVNTELQARIAEINTVNDDILNLMDSTEIATIFLDLKLQVQRFTSPAADIIPLRSIDRGRPLNQLAAPFQDIDLTELSREVLEDLEAREQEVQTKNNKYFFLRIIPYRTIANVVAGVVITFREITEIKKAGQKVADARDFAENIIATVREPLLVLDADLKVISANHSFIKNFLVEEEGTTGKFIYKLGNGQWDIPALRNLLEKMLIDTSEITDYRVDHDFESIGRRSMLLNARRVRQEARKATLILLAIEDITEINKTSQKVTDARDFAENIIATVREPLLVLDADLKVIGANHSFINNFLVDEKRTTGKFIYELGNGQWDIPALRHLLEKMLIDTSEITDYRVDHDFESIGQRSMLLNARRVRQETDKATLILLSIEDITEINKANQKVADARDFAESIIATVRAPLMVLDADLKVIGANHSFNKNFLVKEKSSTGKFIYELGNGQWDIPALRILLEKMLIDTSEITDYRVDHDFESIGKRSMLLNARRVRQEADKATLILLAMEDITDRVTGT